MRGTFPPLLLLGWSSLPSSALPVDTSSPSSTAFVDTAAVGDPTLRPPPPPLYECNIDLDVGGQLESMDLSTYVNDVEGWEYGAAKDLMSLLPPDASIPSCDGQDRSCLTNFLASAIRDRRKECSTPFVNAFGFDRSISRAAAAGDDDPDAPPDIRRVSRVFICNPASHRGRVEYVAEPLQSVLDAGFASVGLPSVVDRSTGCDWSAMGRGDMALVIAVDSLRLQQVPWQALKDQGVYRVFHNNEPFKACRLARGPPSPRLKADMWSFETWEIEVEEVWDFRIESIRACEEGRGVQGNVKFRYIPLSLLTQSAAMKAGRATPPGIDGMVNDGTNPEACRRAIEISRSRPAATTPGPVAEDGSMECL